MDSTTFAKRPTILIARDPPAQFQTPITPYRCLPLYTDIDRREQHPQTHIYTDIDRREQHPQTHTLPICRQKGQGTQQFSQSCMYALNNDVSNHHHDRERSPPHQWGTLCEAFQQVRGRGGRSLSGGKSPDKDHPTTLC